MAIRKAHAIWEGDLMNGRGTMTLGKKRIELPYSFAARFGDGTGSNPEELIGGAHAGCFSMALANSLASAGHPPTKIQTTAEVHLEKTGDRFSIPRIDLETEADVPGIDEDAFQRIALDSKKNCPVSKLLAAAEITLHAKLLSPQQA